MFGSLLTITYRRLPNCHSGKAIRKDLYCYVVTWNVKTYVSHPLKCRMCQNWLKWCSGPPPPPPPPLNYNLTFLTLKSSWSLGGGWWWGGLLPDTPPTTTTTPKLQLDFLDLKSSWSLGVVVGGVWCQTPPPPPTSNFDEKIWSFASNDIMCHISTSNRIWAFKFFVEVGGLGVTPMHVRMCNRCLWLQTGRKQRNFKSLSILYKLRLKSSNMASNTQNAGWSMYI